MDNTKIDGGVTPQVTVFSGAGAQTRDAPPEMLDRLDSAAQREAREVSSAAELLAMLDPPEQAVVQRVELEVAGELLAFHIRRIGFSEAAAIDARKYRRDAGGQIVRDLAYEETTGTAWLLHTCVVHDRNAAGPPGASPDWAPLFEVADIRHRLMASSDPHAIELIYALTSAVWAVNEPLSPLVPAAAIP